MEIKKYSDLYKILNNFKKNNISLYINGKSGIGKTYNITKYFREKKVSFVHLNGYITPLKFYETIYKNPNSILIIDDLHLFIENNVIYSLLLQLTEQKEENIIKYNSSMSNKILNNQNLKSSFVFKGKVIFISNYNLEKNKNKALKNRCLNIVFNPSIEEMFIYIEDNKNYFLNSNVEKKVFKHLKKLKGFLVSFDFRSFKKVVFLINSGFGFFDAFKTFNFKLKEYELYVYFNPNKKNDFIKLFGLSESTYYYILKKFGF